MNAASAISGVKRVVLKVGGAALFRQAGFEKQLLPLLENYREDQVLLLAGGGDLVESMRSLHKIYPAIPTEEMHWRCIDLLDHSMEICNSLLPGDGTVRSQSDFRVLKSLMPKPGTHWIRVKSYYSQECIEAIPATWLPHSNWDTTTDALAWLLAKLTIADELILMKQCLVDPNWSISDAAAEGVVDTEIARLAESNKESSFSILLKQG